MRTVGIIAEYNPLHEGHRYQLNLLKQYFGSDCGVMVALSGPFTQRGEAAILPAVTRARLALAQGADLVLQLPYIYATGAADRFAQGGVEVLTYTGICNYLVFGSEAGELGPLQEAAQTLTAETDSFRQTLQTAQAAGLSYAAAQQEALAQEAPQLAPLLSGSNNLLALSYLKALLRLAGQDSVPQPWTHRREGDSHLQTATELRQILTATSGDAAGMLQRLAPVLPAETTAALLTAQRESKLLLPSSLGPLSLARLLSAELSSLAASPGMGGGLAERLLQTAPALAQTPRDEIWPRLLDSTAARHLTRARIGRALNNWLVGATETDHQEAAQYGPYALRVLAFNKRGRYLLKMMRQHARRDIINRSSDVLEKQHYDRGFVPADYYRRQAELDSRAKLLAARLQRGL